MATRATSDAWITGMQITRRANGRGAGISRTAGIRASEVAASDAAGPRGETATEPILSGPSASLQAAVLS